MENLGTFTDASGLEYTKSRTQIGGGSYAPVYIYGEEPRRSIWLDGIRYDVPVGWSFDTRRRVPVPPGQPDSVVGYYESPTNPNVLLPITEADRQAQIEKARAEDFALLSSLPIGAIIPETLVDTARRFGVALYQSPDGQWYITETEGVKPSKAAPPGPVAGSGAGGGAPDVGGPITEPVNPINPLDALKTGSTLSPVEGLLLVAAVVGVAKALRFF